MQTLLWAAVSLVILVPIIYYLPLGITARGKWGIIGISFILAVIGLFANAVFPMWKTIIIILLLIGLIVYFMNKRFSNSLYLSANKVEKEEILPFQINPPQSIDTKDGGLTEEKSEDLGTKGHEIKPSSLLEDRNHEPSAEIVLYSDISTEDQPSAESIEELLEEWSPVSPDNENALSMSDYTEDRMDSLEHSDFELHEGYLSNPSIESLELSEIGDTAPSNEWEKKSPLEDIDMVVGKSSNEAYAELLENEYLNVSKEKVKLEHTEYPGVDNDSEKPQLVDIRTVDLQISEQTSYIEEVPDRTKSELLETETIEEPLLDIIDENTMISQRDSSEDHIEHDDAAVMHKEQELYEVLFQEPDLEPSQTAIQDDSLGLTDIDDKLTTIDNDQRFKSEDESESGQLEDLSSGETNKIESGDSRITGKGRIPKPLLQTMVSQLELERKRLSPLEYELRIKEAMRFELSVEDYFPFANLLMEHYIRSDNINKLEKLLEDMKGKIHGYPIIEEEVEYVYKHYCEKSL
ncbi:hypothetical protein [Neobacillus muris]|uniref:hypothetical protein n=1 Tax=Neobacillus muris TaxID=2941334 RepID=UPI0020403382|nr:hypothetical protein [Neobacillus muris]